MVLPQKTEVLNQEQEQISLPTVDEVLENFVRMQAKLLDMSILKKFYDTGFKDPLDTTTWCLPILYAIMKEQFELTITPEAFRKRMKKLEKYNLIKSIPRTCPSQYEPVVIRRHVIRKAIVFWLIKRGYQSI